MKKHDGRFGNMRFQVKKKVHSEKIRFKVKDKVEDYVSDEGSRFVNGRWELAILLLFFGQ